MGSSRAAAVEFFSCRPDGEFSKTSRYLFYREVNMKENLVLEALNTLLESGSLRKNDKGSYYLTLSTRLNRDFTKGLKFQGKDIDMSGFQITLNGFNVTLATAAKEPKAPKTPKASYSLADLEADFS